MWIPVFFPPSARCECAAVLSEASLKNRLPQKKLTDSARLFDDGGHLFPGVEVF